MKKLASLLLALSMAVSLTVAISANTTGEVSTASYATVAPVIDGQIDEIWNHTARQTIAVPDDLNTTSPAATPRSSGTKPATIFLPSSRTSA